MIKLERKQKKIITIVSLIVFTVAVMIGGYFILCKALNNYEKQKDIKITQKYVDEKHPGSTLVRVVSPPDHGLIENIAWGYGLNMEAGRQPDLCLYYDPVEDVHYEVSWNGKEFKSDHAMAVLGKQITVEMKDDIENDGFDIKYYLRAYIDPKDREIEEYDNSWVQVAFMTDSPDEDMQKIFDALKYLNKEYIGLNVDMMVSPLSECDKVEHLFDFTDVDRIFIAEKHYKCDFKCGDYKFESIDELYEIFKLF